MKRQKDSLWLKITAVITACVMSFLCVLSVVGTVMFAVNGAYTLNEKQFYVETAGGLIHSDIDNIKEYYKALVNNDESSIKSYKDMFSSENTNLFFTVESEGYPTLSSYEPEEYISKQTFYSNCNISTSLPVTEILAFESASERWAYIQNCKQDFNVIEYGTGDEDVDGDGNYECTLNITYEEQKLIPVKMTVYLRVDMSVNDQYAQRAAQIRFVYSLRYWAIAIAAISFVLTVAAYIYTMCAAGHKRGSEGITLNWIDKIPLDLYVAVLGAGAVALLSAVFNFSDEILAILMATAPLALAFISVSATFAARAKAGGWWRNTIIFRIFVLLKLFALKLWYAIKRVVRNLPFIWIGVTIVIALTIVELIGLRSCFYADQIINLWVIYKIITLPLLIYLFANLNLLQKGGKHIAQGDTDYKIDTSGMIIPSFKTHAENLNSISEGMNKAIAEKLKSERMKTELITNVSHDIKTPLTSIVNYADLLSGAESDEQRAEYIEVIQRHSARLRKLIDDLVEASKASTGNIRIEAEPTDINLLISQSAGEYAERLSLAGIEAVYDCKDEICTALIDGRLMWRVFDNLYSNACKYAQKGTRLYVSTVRENDKIKIVFKNISATPLNISGDELMERFVRGDESRSSDGSGLGLSIAESLVRLHGGDFEIQVDGDLFKAIITLDTFDL